MSVLLLDTSSERLYQTSVLPAALPITVSIWMNTTRLSGSGQSLWLIKNTAVGYGLSMRAQVNQPNDPLRCNFSSPSSQNQADVPSVIAADTWHHCAMVVNSSGHVAGYCDTTKVTDTTNTVGLTTPDYGVIGAWDTIQYFDGELAHAASWSAELTDAEIASLAAGYSPLLIRPQSLVNYLPMIGATSQIVQDVVSGVTWTEQGTPEKGIIPLRIILPSTQRIFVPAAAASGTTVDSPTLTHTYIAQVPQVQMDVASPVMTHTYTAQTPQVKPSVGVPAVTHTYTGQVPTIPLAVVSPIATHTYVGQVPVITIGVTVDSPTVTHTYTAQVPTIPLAVASPVATHTYTGQVPDITAGGVIDAAVATHSYSAQAPGVEASVAAPAVTHTYVGRTARVDAQVIAPIVTHTYTGQVPTMVEDMTVNAPVVSHTYSMLAVINLPPAVGGGGNWLPRIRRKQRR